VLNFHHQCGTIAVPSGLQPFRGNLDNWDPALIDALARGRQVIAFDNRGVAASSGTTPNTIAQMALDAIDFIDALGIGAVDLLGARSISASSSPARRRAAQRDNSSSDGSTGPARSTGTRTPTGRPTYSPA
jgi:hypothetical protein